MKRLSKEQILICWNQPLSLHFKRLPVMVIAVADGSLEYEAMLSWVLEHQE